MPNIYTKIKNTFINYWAWVFDYLYVSYWQVYGFFVRTNEKIYHLDQPSTSIPIILIPGIYENWRFMKPVADLLFKKGHPIHVVSGLGYNVGTVEKMAEIINTYINDNNISECIIVAHSKGGLIGKYLLANHNTNKKIKGMVALNTPFSGSKYAYLMPLKSIRIFLPNSPILSLLSSNTLVNKSIVSIYGQFDPHVPKGSYLEGAQNIQLNTRGHFRIMNNTTVHDAVVKGVASI